MAKTIKNDLNIVKKSHDFGQFLLEFTKKVVDFGFSKCFVKALKWACQDGMDFGFLQRLSTHGQWSVMRLNASVTNVYLHVRPILPGDRKVHRNFRSVQLQQQQQQPSERCQL